MRIVHIMVCITFLLSFQSFGQTNEIEKLTMTIQEGKGDTTEVDARSRMFRLLFQSNPKEGKIHLDKGLQLAKEINYRKGLANCYNRLSIYHTSRGEYDQSLVMLKKGKAIFIEEKDTVGISSCINGEANIRLSQGHYDQALDLYLENATLNENNPSGLAKAKHNISLVHYTLKEYDYALEYLYESLEIRESISDSSGMIYSYNGIGAVLSAQKEHTAALVIHKKALILAQQLGNIPEIASLSNNIGAQYYYLNEFDSTRIYYLKALSIYKLMHAQKNVAEIYSNLGQLECHFENGKLAEQYYDSCLVIAQDIGALATVSIAYEGLSKAHELQGEFEDAYSWHVKFHDLNDSLVGERVKNNINNLQLKYEASQKDLDIVQLEKKQSETNAIASSRKSGLIITIVAALGIIISLILFIGRRNARSRQRAIDLEQRALRAQMNPHFIFNSLNSIQRMYIEGNEDVANDYMADFSRLLRSILENSGKRQITLHEELEISKTYLGLEQMRTDNAFEFHYEIDEDLDQRMIKIPPLILQPYLENAIWHGILPSNKEGKIGINIRELNGDKIQCEIVDNGVGIDTSQKNKKHRTHNSKGMQITQERVGGESNISIEELENGGTRIAITLAYST